MTTPDLKRAMAASIAAELIYRHGSTWDTAVIIEQSEKTASELVDRRVGEDINDRKNLFQAILVLEQEVDESLEAANIQTDPTQAHFWRMRAMSCQNGIDILKRFNLVNPPQA